MFSLSLPTARGAVRVLRGSHITPCIQRLQSTSSGDTPVPKELRIPVPWGHIAAKSWNSEGRRSHRLFGVHGWLDNAATFDTIAPLLPSNVHFVAIDLPGHGLSSHIPLTMKYHVLDWIMEVRRITQQVLKWEVFDMVGHSFGASFSNFYAGTYPETVTKIVGFDQTNFLPTPDKDQAKFNRNCFEETILASEKKASELRLKPFDEYAKRLVESLNDEMKLSSAKILLSRGTSTVGNGLCFLSRDRRLRLLRNFLNFNTKEVESVMAQVQAEVLMLKGTNRNMNRDGLEDGIFDLPPPNYKMIPVEGGHHLHLDYPVRVIGHMCDFLEYGSPRTVSKL